MTKRNREKPRRELRAIAAAVIASPLEVAIELGDERWHLALRALDRCIATTTTTFPARCLAGHGVYVCAWHDADSAVRFSTQILAAADELSLPVRTAIHAGEISIDESGFSGVAVIAAVNASALAEPGEIVLTQPAASMCRSMPADFKAADAWQPPGFAIPMPIYRKSAVQLAPEVMGQLAPAAQATAPVLSQREREVVLFVARGHSNREISGELGIAVGTVERHVANILRKLHFRSRSQIARWAVEQGRTEAAAAAK